MREHSNTSFSSIINNHDKDIEQGFKKVKSLLKFKSSSINRVVDKQISFGIHPPKNSNTNNLTLIQKSLF